MYYSGIYLIWEYQCSIFKNVKNEAFSRIITILHTQILNGHCGRSYCPIQMSFGTCVNTEHINKCVQGNFDKCHTFGIASPQSWQKSRNFTIFAIFAIFDQFRAIRLRATFLRFDIKPSLLHNLDLYQ